MMFARSQLLRRAASAFEVLYTGPNAAASVTAGNMEAASAHAAIQKMLSMGEIPSTAFTVETAKALVGAGGKSIDEVAPMLRRHPDGTDLIEILARDDSIPTEVAAALVGTLPSDSVSPAAIRATLQLARRSGDEEAQHSAGMRALNLVQRNVTGVANEVFGELCRCLPPSACEEALTIFEAIISADKHVDAEEFGPLLELMCRAERYDELLRMWKWMRMTRASASDEAIGAVLVTLAKKRRVRALFDELRLVSSKRLVVPPHAQFAVLEFFATLPSPPSSLASDLCKYWTAQFPDNKLDLKLRLLKVLRAARDFNEARTVLVEALEGGEGIPCTMDDIGSVVPFLVEVVGGDEGLEELLGKVLESTMESVEEHPVDLLGVCAAAAAAMKNRALLGLVAVKLTGQEPELFNEVLHVMARSLRTGDWAAGKLAAAELSKKTDLPVARETASLLLVLQQNSEGFSANTVLDALEEETE